MKMNHLPRPLILAALGILLLGSTGCKRTLEVFYLHLPGTVFDQSSDTQTARVCFTDETHVSIVQTIYSSGRTLVSNGVYEAEGHRVQCHNANGEGNVVQFVRTFSHLKNTSNKNLTGMAITAHESLSGSVWTTVLNGSLLMNYFPDDTRCVSASHTASGWSFGTLPCQLEGSRVRIDRSKGGLYATLYKDVMLVDSLGVVCNSPAVKAEGKDDLAGTFWTRTGGGLPGIIVFTAPGHFTRTQVSSSDQRIFETLQGTYTLSGNNLTFSYAPTPDSATQQESCQVAEDGIRFQNVSFSRVTLAN